MGIPDEIETGGVTPPHTHTHTWVLVSSLFSKSTLKWREGGLQYDILEILNFVGVFFLIIVGQTFSNIKYSGNLKRVCNSRFLYRFL